MAANDDDKKLILARRAKFVAAVDLIRESRTTELVHTDPDRLRDALALYAAWLAVMKTGAIAVTTGVGTLIVTTAVAEARDDAVLVEVATGAVPADTILQVQAAWRSGQSTSIGVIVRPFSVAFHR